MHEGNVNLQLLARGSLFVLPDVGSRANIKASVRISSESFSGVKGAHVQIEGEIRTRDYSNGDVKRSVTEIRVRNISKLERPAKAEANGAAA